MSLFNLKFRPSGHGQDAVSRILLSYVSESTKLTTTTSMMASLIHTNRESTNINTSPENIDSKPSSFKAAAAVPPRRKPRRQLTLDTSFRPVKVETIERDIEIIEDKPTTTLVVCPVSLLNQWESELLKSAAANSLSVFSKWCCLIHVWQAVVD